MNSVFSSYSCWCYFCCSWFAIIFNIYYFIYCLTSLVIFHFCVYSRDEKKKKKKKLKSFWTYTSVQPHHEISIQLFDREHLFLFNWNANWTESNKRMSFVEGEGSNNFVECKIYHFNVKKRRKKMYRFASRSAFTTQF